MGWQWVIIWDINLNGSLQWLSSSLQLQVPEAGKMYAFLGGPVPRVQTFAHPVLNGGHFFQVKAMLNEVHWRSWSEWRFDVGKKAEWENLLRSRNVIQLRENEGVGGISLYFSISDTHIIYAWQRAQWEQRLKDYIPKKEGPSSHAKFFISA